MALIGMLHHRKDPTTVIKSYAYAELLKQKELDFSTFPLGK